MFSDINMPFAKIVVSTAAFVVASAMWKARVENQTVAKKKVISRDVIFNKAQMLNTDVTSSEKQGYIEIELHEQRIKSADESTDEQSLEIQRSILLECNGFAKESGFPVRTKHIVVHYHRVWEWINSRQIVMHQIHTNDNAADMLTKTVTTEKLKHWLSLIHLLSC
ncbi:hypothetical protein RJ639_005208 [Escallonia herrerae]|uniref:Uncharacterized protein n=1 Tax=Escallonia herrerae TaxID=1293975 RepID=A0AA88W112_9ASTE|nr:hypothetical protein RJ639_005208 [Escallonia herrerae]